MRLAAFGAAWGAAAVVAFGGGASAKPVWSCQGALCGAAALAPYFDALQARTGLEDAPPVHVLIIGDSHSAGDAISGAWRDSLQARYGGGGRGVLPPGDPYAGFLPRGVHVDQSAGWRVQGTFGKAAPADPDAVFGISGFSLTAYGPGASITLTAQPQSVFSRLVVCAVTGPGAGGYVVNLGGASLPVSLSRGAGAGADCHSFSINELETSASVTTTSGPVTLLSWATFRTGGVAVSNLGVVGAQLRHFARAEDRVIAQELTAYAPDLIVLEFGTNEGFGGRFDPASYEAGLRRQIERLRRLSGGAPILVLGAPDAGTDRAELAHNAPTPPGSPTAAELATGGWFPPPALAAVRAIQRRVAAEETVAFWDWAAAMGGPGAAQAWAAAGLMRHDHVHYTTAGGAEIARRLQADLDAAASAPNP